MHIELLNNSRSDVRLVKAETKGSGRRFKGETTLLIYEIEVKQSADARQTMGGKGRKGFNETKRPWFVGAPSRGPWWQWSQLDRVNANVLQRSRESEGGTPL